MRVRGSIAVFVSEMARVADVAGQEKPDPAALGGNRDRKSY